MKANELRVGTLFHPIDRSGEVHLPVTLRVFRVITIHLFRVEACLINENPAQIAECPSFDMHDMSPVPLTEEWLMKFGFEKKDNGLWHNGMGSNLFYDLDNSNVRLALADLEKGTAFPIAASNIRYIHQLQNYFAATGEELKLPTYKKQSP